MMNSKITKYSLSKTKKKLNKSDRIRFLLIAVFCLFAIFQSGLRDLNKLPAGNDTRVYEMRYYEMLRVPWSSVMNDFAIISNEYSGRDSGYEVFMKLTQYIWGDFTFFMFLTAIAFMVPFGMLIYKYVKSYLGIVLVFMIYFAIFTNVVNSFMRQGVALGITLFSIRYIIKREWKCYYGLMLVALSVHSSAIAAFPFYFLTKLSKSEKWLRLSFIASPIMILFLRPLLSYFVEGTIYDNYVKSEIVNPQNYMALIVSISILPLLFYKELKQVKDNDILISAMIGTMLFLPVVFMGNTMLRISYYYVFVLILLLPVVIEHVKQPKMAKVSLYLILIIFFIFMIYR